MRSRILHTQIGILTGFLPLIVYELLAGDSTLSIVLALGAATVVT
jgi:hypothetical protein